jgi:hypothetical protein
VNEIRIVGLTETETGRNSRPIISAHTEYLLYTGTMEKLGINHKYRLYRSKDVLVIIHE